MGFTFLKLIGILTVLAYFGVMFFMKGSKNKMYLFFILLSFPFLHIILFNEFTVFDVVSILHLLIFTKNDKTEKKELMFYNILLLVLFLNIVIGYVLSDFNIDNESWFKLIRFFSAFIFPYILIRTIIQDETFLMDFQKRFPILVAFCLIFLGLQIAIGIQVSLVKTLNPNVAIASGFRYPGIFSDPQQFAQFLGGSSFLLLLQFDSNEKFKNLKWVLFGLCVMGIFAAGGRAGLMGWCLGLFLFLFFSKPEYKFYLLGFSILIGTVIFFFQDKLAIFNRGTDLQDTYDFRYQIWLQALQIFFENPFFGIGLGNYGDYVFLHFPEQVWIINNEIVAFDHPESGYLLFLSELGGIGFLAIALLILIPIIKSMMAYYREKNMNYILLIGAALCWIVGFYSTNSLGDIRMKIFITLIFGILISYRLQQKDLLMNQEDAEELDSN